MERLTERDEFGNADIIGVDSVELQGNLDFKELNRVTRALNRLAELEDKLESGHLADTTPYIVEIKSDIPFKYKVIKPTIHRRNVEMCGSRESAESLLRKLQEKK